MSGPIDFAEINRAALAAFLAGLAHIGAQEGSQALRARGCIGVYRHQRKNGYDAADTFVDARR
jgi:hypothetical protein